MSASSPAARLRFQAPALTCVVSADMVVVLTVLSPHSRAALAAAVVRRAPARRSVTVPWGELSDAFVKSVTMLHQAIVTPEFSQMSPDGHPATLGGYIGCWFMYPLSCQP